MAIGKWKNSLLKSKFNYESKAQIYFVQRYCELLHYKTLNSYQYSVNNTFTLLYEIYEIIKKVKNQEIGTSNLKFLVDELKETAKTDPIIEHFYPNVKYAILELKSKDYNESNSYQISALNFKINGFINQLAIDEGYLEKILCLMKEAIDEDGDYELIDKTVGILVSQLIYLGIHPRSLASKMHSIFLNDKKEFNERWRGFLTFIDQEGHTKQTVGYICVKILDKNLDANKSSFSTDILSIKTKDDILSLLADNQRKQASTTLENGNYLLMKTEVYRDNIFRSIEEALGKLEQLLAMAAFNEKSIRIDKSSIAIMFKEGTDDEEYRLLNHQNLFELGSNKARNQLNHNFLEIQNYIEQLSSTDQERVSSSVKNYSLATSSYSPETSFLMLWSSLESLLKIGIKRSNIDHLCQIIPSLLSLKYILILVENYMYDLRYAGCKELIFIDSKEEKNWLFSTRDELTSQRLINLFKCMTNKNFKLQTDLSNYSLLEERYKTLKEKFSQPKQLHQTLSKHNLRINWHIIRLYRVRNGLIHSATADSNISVLSEHLDFYVREILTVFLNNLDSFISLGLGSSIIFLEDKYTYLLELIKGTNKYTPEITNLLFPENQNFLY